MSFIYQIDVMHPISKTEGTFLGQYQISEDTISVVQEIPEQHALRIFYHATRNYLSIYHSTRLQSDVVAQTYHQ
jgi:hypothetical protein